jgi:pimeloyl-ACP methyl ester carboxylesterase
MRSVSLGVVLVVLISLASAQSNPTKSSPPRVEGSWTKVACPFDVSKALLPVDCGLLKVPENYDQPGRTIEVAFMVVHPEHDRDTANPVIFLSGGPGSPSLVHVETLVTTSAIREVVVDRKWVFFDQRGGGRSIPSLFCQPADDWFKGVRECRDRLIKQGVDLSQYNSARIASDTEALRKALGVKQWNVWGVSYGSRLGFTIARYYPSSVRTLLVDGPYLPEDQEGVEDARGAEVVLNRIFWKCTADAACSAKYPNLRNRFMAVLPRLHQQPLLVGQERFDDSRVASFLVDTLYGGASPTFEQRVQRDLAYADAAARGDAQLMLQIEQRMKAETPPRPNLPEVGQWNDGQNRSVQCHEEKVFESVDEHAQAAAQSDFIRATFGYEGLDGIFKTCALWGAGRADAIENTHVYYDGPILAFTGELDPTLSGIAGYKIEMLYPNARNIVFSNAGHAQFYIRTYNYSPEEYVYRRCALQLGNQFIADPLGSLDTRCASSRRLRLIEGAAALSDVRPTDESACSGSQTEVSNIETTVRAFFAALRRDDKAAVQRLATPSFYAFDGGARFSAGDLADAVRSSHASGMQLNWNIGEIDAHVGCKMAWAAWENNGSAGVPPRLSDVRWLESAVLLRQDRTWKIEFLHSARADAK